MLQPKIKLLYDLNGDTALQNLYLELEFRVKVEIANLESQQSELLPGPLSVMRTKIEFIKSTLHMLRRTIFIKEHINEYLPQLGKPEEWDLDLTDLSHYQFRTEIDLLSYAPKCYSENKKTFVNYPCLGTALNMSRQMTLLFGSHRNFVQPLFGKCTSLLHIEKSIAETIVDLPDYKARKQKITSNDTLSLFRRQDSIDEQRRSEQRKERELESRVEKNGPGGR